MASKRGLKQRLREAVRKREGKPRPQVIPTGDVRSDRWHEITSIHADVLADIEGTILETARYVTGMCDHWTHLGLIGAMRDDLPDHPCSTMLYEALKRLRQAREDVDDQLWLDALRVVDQSVRDRSSLRHGDRSYLSFIGAFFEDTDELVHANDRVTQDRVQRPVRGISPDDDVVVGFAWYRREQWPLLLANSVDADELERTYEEWLAGAERRTAELQKAGMKVQKVDVDIHALLDWCTERGQQLDGEARAEYAGEKMSKG